MSRKIEAIFALKDQFTQNLTKIENKMMTSTRKIGALQSQIRKGSRVVQSAGMAMSKYVTAPIVGAGAASVKAASDFETHFAKLKTIADTSKKTGVSVGTLKNQLRKLSDETGASQSSLAEATYQAISAGRSTKEAVSFVGQAGKLAKGGFTDMSTATDTLTTIMNAYGKSAGNAESISSKLILTQNLGKTTVGELGATMGKVVPTANMYKVGLDKLASAYVTTTKNGINTAQSTTVINSMLTQLGKGSTSAAKALKAGTGHSLEELMKKGWSLTDVVKAVDKQSKKSGKTLGETFNNVNATKGAATLLQHGKDYIKALKGMAKSSGLASKSAKTMANTMSNQMKTMKTRVTNIAIEIGQTILPMINPILKKVEGVITKISKAFSGMSSGAKKHLVSVLGTVAMVGPALVVVSKVGFGIANVVKMVGTFSKSMKVAGGFVKLLTSPLGMTVIALTAVAVVTLLVIKHWKTVKAVALAVWKPIGAVIKSVGAVFSAIVNAIKSGGSFIIGIFKKCGVSAKGMASTFAPVKSEAKKLGNQFKPVAVAIKSAIASAVKALKSFVKSIASVYNKIKPYLDLIMEMYKQVFKAKLTMYISIAGNLFKVFANTVSTVVSSILKVLNGITTFISGVFTGNWRKAWQGVKDIFKGIFSGFAAIAKAPLNAAIGVINGALSGINSISVDVPSWVPGMGGKHLGFSIPKIPYLAKGTDKWQGGPAIINEKGGEIVDLPNGTRVIPHDRSINSLVQENLKLEAIIKGFKNALVGVKPTTITNNVDASKKDYSSNRFSDLSRLIKNAIDRSYNLSNKYSDTRNNTNNAKQSYTRSSSYARKANSAYKSMFKSSKQSNTHGDFRRSVGAVTSHTSSARNNYAGSFAGGNHSALTSNYDLFRHVINYDTSAVNRNTNNAQSTTRYSTKNAHHSAQSAIKYALSNAVSKVMQSVAYKYTSAKSAYKRAVSNVASSANNNTVRSLITAHSMYNSEKGGNTSNAYASNNAVNSMHKASNAYTSSLSNNAYSKSSNAINSAMSLNKRYLAHNASSHSAYSASTMSQLNSRANNSALYQSTNRYVSTAKTGLTHIVNAGSNIAQNVSNVSQKHGVSVANSKHNAFSRVRNYDTSNSSSLNMTKTSTLKNNVSPLTSIKNIASSIVNGAHSAVKRNIYSSTNKKSSVLTTNNSTSNNKYNSNSNRYLNDRTYSTANNTSNAKTANDYHNKNDNRKFYINIAKLADKFVIDGNEDIDHIANELAKQLKLAIANMD